MTAPLPVWLAAARYRAVQERPYLAAALWAVTFVPRPGMGSMAIDRWGRLYYDPAVGTMWSVEEVATILVHEVHHLLRAHHERVGQYPPAVANAAADFEVNDDLAREGARFPTRVVVDGEEIPIQPLLPEGRGLPPNRTAEEYAELLLASPASLPFPPRGGVAGAREDRAADPAGGSAADSESAADSAGSRAGERADAAASAAADTPLAAPADATASAARSGSTAAGGAPAAGGGQLPPDTPASSRGQSGSGDPALPPVPTAGGGGSAVTGRRAPWEDPEPGEPGA
ncbi:MAG: hypothetical protein NZ761_00580, partial [Dehalococcoidia bacterium]|nr:hypothetical protein [Dehalococcoidia bacterium]